MLEFSTQKTLTARKEHKCLLCGQKIGIGQKYIRHSGKYDGDFFDDCFHESCYDLIAKF